MRFQEIFLVSLTGILPSTIDAAVTVKTQIYPYVLSGTQFNISCIVSNVVPARVAVFDQSGIPILGCDILSKDLVFAYGYGAFRVPLLDGGQSTAGCKKAYGQMTSAIYPFYVTANIAYVQDGNYRCAVVYYQGGQMLAAVDPSPSSRLTVFVLPSIQLIVPPAIGGRFLNGSCFGNAKPMPTLRVYTTCQNCTLVIANVQTGFYNINPNVQFGYQLVSFVLEYTYNWNGAFLYCSYMDIPGYRLLNTTQVIVPAPVFTSTIPALVNISSFFEITCSVRNAYVTWIEVLDSSNRPVMWCNCYNVNGTGAFAFVPGYLTTAQSDQSCKAACRQRQAHVSFFVRATINPLQDGYYRCSYSYMNGTLVSKFIDKPSPLVIAVPPFGLTLSPLGRVDYNNGENITIYCALSAKPPTDVYFITALNPNMYRTQLIQGGASTMTPDFAPVTLTAKILTLQASHLTNSILVFCFPTPKYYFTMTYVNIYVRPENRIMVGAAVNVMTSTAGVSTKTRDNVSLVVIFTIITSCPVL